MALSLNCALQPFNYQSVTMTEFVSFDHTMRSVNAGSHEKSSYSAAQ